MGDLLYVVRDVVRLRGAGLVVLAKVASEGACLRTGDAVELRRAGGSAVVTEVVAFPVVNPYDFRRQVPPSFPGGVAERDVPAGTEIWSHP